MQKVRVGVIGAGNIAGGHARAYRERDDVELVAIADVDLARAEEAGRRWSCQASTVEQLLERSDIDAVSLCTPPNSHAELTIEALKQGKHVLVEKPIALSLEETDAMIATANAANRTLMVAQTHRYWPANVRAKELIEEGAIGELISVVDEVLSDNRVNGDVVPWRLQRAIAGGGVVMDNGVHSLDRLAWWVSSPVRTVYGKVSTDIDPIDVENNALAVLTFANGVTAHSRLSFTTPRKASRCRAEFVGTEGIVQVETWGEIVRIGFDGKTEVLPHDRTRTGLQVEIADFIESIKEGRAPQVTAEVGRHALELVLAVYRSAESGEAVHLNT